MSGAPHRILGRFFSRPLLLAPGAAETISAFLLSRLSGPAAAGGLAGVEHDAGESREIFPAAVRGDGTAEVHSPRASRFYGEYPMSEDGSRRPLPFRRTTEGVANITLVGEWVNRGGYIGASSGLISYEGFKVQMLAAAADPRTKAILLDLESPGGEAVGAFEAAEVVRQVAARKPVTAVVNGMAASAAYAIASAASRIVSIPTGISGSIGVVLMHLDVSEYLKAEGLKPTFIFAGDHKVDGNPYEPLPESVRADLQREVEGFYAKFVETVAKGRAGLDEKAIRATEARCFMGEEAVAAGLVDAIGTFEEVLADLSAAPNRSSVGRMSRPNGRSTARTSKVTDEDVNATRADERARIGAIVNSPEARGREKQAMALAVETDLTPEAAIRILNVSPKASSFDSRMAGRAELNLDPDAPASGHTGAKQEGAVDWDDIAAEANARLPANARVPGRQG